ncbi:MAG: hypothetical protein LM590_15790 [Thermofilum sp.]|nr:hypothetical protein [Thermofilum sp.]
MRLTVCGWLRSDAGGSLIGRLLLELAGSAALGAGLLLAWVYALSLLGFSCPSWDPRLSIVPRAVLLPLGYGGALLWALLLLPPSLFAWAVVARRALARSRF